MNDQDNALVVSEQGFGIETTRQQTDVAVTAMAARATAMIQARCVMALQRPRNIDLTRTKLLQECRRPNFAREARFRKPVGSKKDQSGRWVQAFVEGPSIRFAEAAMRCLTNIATDTTVVVDDPEKMVQRVAVTDLESNVVYEQEFTVRKTVERRSLKKGQTAIKQRINTYGDTVYIVEATDDDIANKVNAMTSKVLRNLGLRHLPGDIKDECMRLCERVAADADAKDPDQARKALIDAFATVGVDASQIEAFLGHSSVAIAPAELAELRAIFSAIRDGEATWADMASTSNDEEEPKKSAAQSRAAEVVASRKRKAKEKSDPKAAAPPQPEQAREREPGEEG